MSRHYYSIDSSATLAYRLGLDNVTSNVVQIRWSAYTPNGSFKYKVQTLSTAFRPLSVTADARLSQTLYVTGWVERTGEVVVEEWELGDTLLAVSTNGAGAETVNFVLPEVRRRELTRSPQGAVYDSAFHPATRELYLLQDLTYDGSLREITSVSVDAEEPQRDTIYDSGQIAILDTCEGMSVGVLESDASVYVCLFSVSRWGHESVDGSVSGAQSHVLHDVDRDGVFEVSYDGPYLEIANLGATLDWDERYAADAP